MSKIQVKVSVEAATVEVEKMDFFNAWKEHWEENIQDEETGDDCPEPTDEFVIEMFAERLNDGDQSLDEIFDGYEIKVEAAE